MMTTHNQKCNALSSIIGIFCHANNTPEKVIEVLSRMGISISLGAIQDAITSLSKDAIQNIRDLGQTLMFAYAFDNFDVDLKSSIPTIENSADSLHHLTSALLFPLPAGTSKEDLRCSEKLWEQSQLNDTLPDNRPNLATKPNWRNLLKIQPHLRIKDSEGMTCRDRWNAWKFLHTLVHEGPVYFHQFRTLIGEPEDVEKILLSKTRTCPMQSMNISNSTVSGNIDAIINLMAQAGVGDPMEIDDETIESLVEYVVLFHGDLATGERITAAQLQRAIEASPYRRLQFVIFVFGLFHLKMACADTLWRIFIRQPLGRLDESSVMAHVHTLRASEVGKIQSNPGFRRMHQVITHDGICRRLDCWRVEVKKQNPSITSLEQFAGTEPTIHDLQELANRLAMDYVASSDSLFQLRSQPQGTRDQQYENGLIVNQYYLLYEELSYAMNIGDIGRVEHCFLPWTALFKATGKHKYAAAIVQHVHNVHFVFDRGLAYVRPPRCFDDARLIKNQPVVLYDTAC